MADSEGQAVVAEATQQEGQAGAVAAQPGTQKTALPCAEPPSFSQACGLVESPYSCLVVATHRRHLALPPRYLNKKRSGIREKLSEELLRYSTSLEGVPMAYDNLNIVGELGDIYDDVGFIHLNVQADFVIFQPQRGQKLVGVVNKVAPSHIGCLVHGCFNASIPKPTKMPIEAWQYIGVNIGDHMEFEVSRLDSDAVGVFCIRGFLDKQLEAQALAKLNEETKGNDPETSETSPANTADAPEDADEQTAEETIEIPKDIPKRKAKKRHNEETLPENVTETPEGWSTSNTSLEEIPKKKKKKHKQLNSQNDTVEADAFTEISSLENTVLESSSLSADISKRVRKNKKAKDLLPSMDPNGNLQTEESILHSLGNESFVPDSQEKTKKSKKRKPRDHSDVFFDGSVQNGVLEDSGVTENTVLEDSVATLETLPESRPKKHKKKHKKRSGLSLEFPNDETAPKSEEPQPDIQLETPKHKKHKRKKSDTGAVQTQN